MARRETVVAAGLQVKELVERIPVGHPRRAFLLGREEIAVAIPLQGHDVAQAADELLDLAIRRNPQEAAAVLVGRIVVHAGFLLLPIRILIGGAAHREVERPVGSERHRHGVVDTAVQKIAGRRESRVVETAGEHLARFGHAVAVAIAETDNFAREDEVGLAIFHRDAEWIVGAGFGGERVDLVFEPVAVGIAEHMEAAVVAAREEPPVRRVFDVVEAGERDRQLADSETGHEDLGGRSARGGGFGDKRSHGGQQQSERELHGAEAGDGFPVSAVRRKRAFRGRREFTRGVPG